MSVTPGPGSTFSVIGAGVAKMAASVRDTYTIVGALYSIEDSSNVCVGSFEKSRSGEGVTYLITGVGLSHVALQVRRVSSLELMRHP